FGIRTNSERNNMRGAKPVKGKVEAGDRRFLGIALAPCSLAQAPADFKMAGKVSSARRIDTLQSTEAKQFSINLALDQPEGVAIVALIAFQSLEGRIPGWPVLNPAHVPHYRRRVHDRIEKLAIPFAPLAKPEPLSFDRDPVQPFRPRPAIR